MLTQMEEYLLLIDSVVYTDKSKLTEEQKATFNTYVVDWTNSFFVMLDNFIMDHISKYPQTEEGFVLLKNDSKCGKFAFTDVIGAFADIFYYDCKVDKSISFLDTINTYELYELITNSYLIEELKYDFLRVWTTEDFDDI